MDADVVVLGLGAMGSASAFSLAEAGLRVIGLDAAPHAGHDLGSSHGESRIIRQAYFEDPAYVPLVQEAWRGWEALEARTGSALLVRTGGLMIGRRDAAVVAGSLRSASAHGLAHEVFEPGEVRRRFPPLSLRADEVAVYEPMAGFVRPEAAVRAFAAAATSSGADLRFGVRAARMRSMPGAIEVETTAGVLRAQRAVVAVGAWTGKLFPDLFPLLVERQVQHWFWVAGPASFRPESFPVFLREEPDGRQVYGFPSLDGLSIKVALHHGGAVVDPDRVSRTVDRADWAALLPLVRDLIPAVNGPPLRSAVCLYTNTPDGHFIVGPHPDVPGAVVLAGFSGHGFKFAPVVGRLARDLVTGVGTAPALFDPGRRFRD